MEDSRSDRESESCMSKPSIREIIPILGVADIERAVNWYTRVLGAAARFPVAELPEEEVCGLEVGGVRLILVRAAGSNATYYNVAGIREFYRQIEHEVEIVTPLTPAQNQKSWSFSMRDPDRNVLAFAETEPEGTDGFEMPARISGALLVA
jgi:catechol 2,3-dioxygenase-like lactoylglutathione lyase family enzyme